MFPPGFVSDGACSGSPLLFEGRGGGLIRDESIRTPHLHPLPLSKGRGGTCIPLSQHACLFEAEIAGVPLRRRANDDVVEQFDLQQFRGFGQTSRQTVVRLAR